MCPPPVAVGGVGELTECPQGGLGGRKSVPC